jgi:hypothetical protein
VRLAAHDYRSSGPYLVFLVLDDRTIWRNGVCLDEALAEWWDMIDLQRDELGRHVIRVLDIFGAMIVDFGPYGLGWTDEVVARHPSSEAITRIELAMIEMEVARCP